MVDLIYKSLTGVKFCEKIDNSVRSHSSANKMMTRTLNRKYKYIKN
jgi:hypothetical protein